MCSLQESIDISAQGRCQEAYDLALGNLLKAAIKFRDRRHRLAKEKAFEEAYKKEPKDQKTLQKVWTLSS